MPAREVLPYIAVQVAGAFAGVMAAHLMFEAPLLFASAHARTGPAQWWSEFVATFGLLAVIIGCSRSRPAITPFAVAAYITAAYWFTASTSFANPAVTLARAASDTFAGIRPVDAPGFILAQLAGAAVATIVFCWLYPGRAERRDRGGNRRAGRLRTPRHAVLTGREASLRRLRLLRLEQFRVAQAYGIGPDAADQSPRSHPPHCTVLLVRRSRRQSRVQLPGSCAACRSSFVVGGWAESSGSKIAINFSADILRLSSPRNTGRLYSPSSTRLTNLMKINGLAACSRQLFPQVLEINCGAHENV